MDFWPRFGYTGDLSFGGLNDAFSSGFWPGESLS